MGAGNTNVKVEWVDGNLVLYDKSKNIILTVDGTNRKLTFPSGSEFELQSGATADIADILLAAADVALAEGSVLVGNAAGAAAALAAETDAQILVGNGTTVTSVAVSGDATMDNAGAVTLADGIVRTATVSVDCGAGGTAQTTAIVTLPANSTVLDVHALCTEVFNGDTTQDLSVGVSGTAAKYLASADYENGANDINANDEAFASNLGTPTAPAHTAAGESIIATWSNDASASTGIVKVTVTYYTEA